MEKYLKNLSIVLMVMTTFLFLNAYGAAKLVGTDSPQIISNVLIIGANALFFLVPIMYLIIFGISISTLFKRVLNRQPSISHNKVDKFPMIWLILSTVCFFIYYGFFNIILS